MSAFADLRVVSPLLLAVAAFAVRELLRPVPPPALEVVHAVALPIPRGEAAPKREQEYELDADASVVRFCVREGTDELLLACPGAKGRLVLATDPTACRVELEFDLGRLQGVGAAVADVDLWHVLGTHKNGSVDFRAELVSAATTPLPALRLDVFRGDLRFGGRTVRRTLELWQTALPGRPLRLQGDATFAADALGLPPRRTFPFLHEGHVVTLGLDLAWKRTAHR